MGSEATPRFANVCYGLAQKVEIKLSFYIGSHFKIWNTDFFKEWSDILPIIYYLFPLAFLVLNFFYGVLVLHSLNDSIIKVRKNFESQQNDINDKMFNSY